MIHSTRKISCTFAVLVLVIQAWAQDIDAYFLKGNEYYQQGDYQAAIEEYQKIIDTGYESWQVYYNLGNAYFKQREIALAILNFERAKKLNPENEDINYNLEIANLATVDRIQELPQFFFLNWISKISQMVSLNTLAWIAITSYFVLVAMLIMRMFIKSTSTRKMLVGVILVAAVFLVFFSGLLSYQIYENETKESAVVLVDKVDVKSAPDNAGTDVFTLHEGVKVQIEDRSLNWVKIKLADGKVGWLQEQSIERI